MGSKLNICKSFGSVRFLIFGNENFLNLSEAFFLKEFFYIFFFAFKREIFEEDRFILFLFTIFMVIAATHSNDWSISNFYFLSFQFRKYFISNLLRVKFYVSSLFITFYLTSDLFDQILVLFWNNFGYLFFGSFRR